MRFPPEPRVTDDQHMVEQMIVAGMTFGEVEDAIERLPAGDEKKSALWLTAWSRLGRSGRRPSPSQPRSTWTAADDAGHGPWS